MFSKTTIDLLFNLLLIFVCLFFLAFIQINDSENDDANIDNKNSIMITMRWEANNDMDLWLMLPNGKHVGYSKRDVPPAHLDVDVVAWRRFRTQEDNYNQIYSPSGNFGEHDKEHEIVPGEYVIRKNEEIISIRNAIAGEYVVNVHYFSDRGYKNTPIRVEVLAYDVRNRRVIYAGAKYISRQREETHYVKFTVMSTEGREYKITNVYTDRPTYFVGKEE